MKLGWSFLEQNVQVPLIKVTGSHCSTSLEGRDGNHAVCATQIQYRIFGLARELDEILGIFIERAKHETGAIQGRLHAGTCPGRDSVIFCRHSSIIPGAICRLVYYSNRWRDGRVDRLG